MSRDLEILKIPVSEHFNLNAKFYFKMFHFFYLCNSNLILHYALKPCAQKCFF